MKHVAICIKGAVSKMGKAHDRFLYSGDLYKNGNYVNFKAVRNGIYKHIINANRECTFDFFFTWMELRFKRSIDKLI